MAKQSKVEIRKGQPIKPAAAKPNLAANNNTAAATQKPTSNNVKK